MHLWFWERLVCPLGIETLRKPFFSGQHFCRDGFMCTSRNSEPGLASDILYWGYTCETRCGGRARGQFVSYQFPNGFRTILSRLCGINFELARFSALNLRCQISNTLLQRFHPDASQVEFSRFLRPLRCQ